MSSFKQGMFRRLHQSDKKRILISLGEHRTPIMVKGGKDEIFQMMTSGFQGDDTLEVRVVASSKKPVLDQPVIVNFVFGYERYFFQGYMTVEAERCLIQASNDFYILQRRKYARLTLPENYPSGFNMIEMAGKPVFLDMKILDFSSGGLKLYFADHDPRLETDMKVKGVLHLGIRRPLTLDGLVRHVGRKNDGDYPGQTLGLQFDSSNKIMEVKLLTIFMDVQREIFMKYEK